MRGPQAINSFWLRDYNPNWVAYRRSIWKWYFNYQFKKVLIGKKKQFECHYCHGIFPIAKATLEHVIPLSQGGVYDNKNLKLACTNCNSRPETRAGRRQQLERTKAKEARRKKHIEDCWNPKTCSTCKNLLENK
jgi:5-methylcytosine-specific restriction endonuclease McrA